MSNKLSSWCSALPLTRAVGIAAIPLLLLGAEAAMAQDRCQICDYTGEIAFCDSPVPIGVESCVNVGEDDCESNDPEVCGLQSALPRDITVDGSLIPSFRELQIVPSSAGMYVAAEGAWVNLPTSDVIEYVRRSCNKAIVRRFMSEAHAARVRAETSTLLIGSE